jgi:hypothetical protein
MEARIEQTVVTQGSSVVCGYHKKGEIVAFHGRWEARLKFDARVERSGDTVTATEVAILKCEECGEEFVYDMCQIEFDHHNEWWICEACSANLEVA